MSNNKRKYYSSYPIPDNRHGTSVGYRYYRCRCSECKVAGAKRNAVDRKRMLADPVRRKAHRDNQTTWNKANRYGITVSELQALLAGASCALCDSEENLCVDHDHSTGKVRGVLCRNCNWGLGNFEDDMSRISRIAAYLAY